MDGIFIIIVLFFFFFIGFCFVNGLVISNMFVICFLVIVLIDLFLGIYFMYNVWMSYFVMEVVCYIGIGDEMMGVVFGVFFLFSLLFLNMWYGFMLLVVIVGLFIFFMVWLEGGVKVGVLFVGIIMFGFLFVLKYVCWFDWCVIFMVLLILCVVLGFVVVWDIYLNSS